MFKNWEILVRFVDRVWHFDVAERFRVRFFLWQYYDVCVRGGIAV